MPRVPPELNLKIGPFSVSAKGVEAVRAIRWPVAFAVTILVPIAVCGCLRPIQHRHSTIPSAAVVALVLLCNGITVTMHLIHIV